VRIWHQIHLNCRIKFFAISLPFLGCYLGFHIFFHNGLLGATHFFTAGLFCLRYHFPIIKRFHCKLQLNCLLCHVPMVWAAINVNWWIWSVKAAVDYTISHATCHYQNNRGRQHKTMDYVSPINPEFGCCKHSITVNRCQMSRISGFIMQCIVNNKLNEVASTKPSNALIPCK